MENQIISPAPAATLPDAVDQLGFIRAQIADLQEIEKQLKAAIESSEDDKVTGRLYKAAIVRSAGRVSIDWKSIAERFNPSRQLIAAHTSHGAAFTAIRISAR